MVPTALCLQRLELRCLKIGNLKEEKVFQRRQLRNLDGGTVTENQGHENSVLVRALFIQSTLQVTPGVSIKFEVGSWLKKNNRLYEQGAVRPINLGGSGGMLPQKILKSGGSEMPFPAFWAPNYHASTSGNYSLCMAI